MFPAAFIVVAIAAPAFAGNDDDTLRFYLSKSSLVVSGTIVDNPTAVGSEVGVVRYGFKFKVAKVLKGKTPDEEIHVYLTHYHMGNVEEPPYLKKDGKAILFLRRAIDRKDFKSWASADGWFGIQPFNSAMEAELKAVADEE